MKKRTKEEFKEDLEHRVNLIGKSFTKLVELVEARPDLLTTSEMQKVQAYLHNTLVVVGRRCETAITRYQGNVQPFSLDAAVAPPDKPIPRTSRSVAPPRDDDDDGFSFIETAGEVTE